MNIRQHICLLIGYAFFFFIGTSISAILEFLGNGEAIKLSRINLNEALDKYFNYLTFSYNFGIICILVGIYIVYVMSDKFSLFKEINKK